MGPRVAYQPLCSIGTVLGAAEPNDERARLGRRGSDRSGGKTGRSVCIPSQMTQSAVTPTKAGLYAGHQDNEKYRRHVTLLEWSLNSIARTAASFHPSTYTLLSIVYVVSYAPIERRIRQKGFQQEDKKRKLGHIEGWMGVMASTLGKENCGRSRSSLRQMGGEARRRATALARIATSHGEKSSSASAFHNFADARSGINTASRRGTKLAAPGLNAYGTRVGA
ncbi:hypothetical protein HPB51_015198 [Rhipicephalus microplus]|uniref:Uncharacterized protein n=1 Tax=Rhipicephalus microplus TaxID=6941 RepID=A0A9J6DAN5_RHIMP|nr:hypothetical protein HPB51_015198 [Rhipicephalus microplus]